MIINNNKKVPNKSINRFLLVYVLLVLLSISYTIAHGENEDDDDDTVHSKNIDTFTSTFAFEHTININIKLVGFTTTNYNELQKLLNHLDNSNIPTIMTPYSNIPFIKQKYLYYVSAASIKLKDDIQSAIKDNINSAEYKHPTLKVPLIPYTVVDKFIWNDYIVEKSNSYTIYVINSDAGMKYTYSQQPLVDPQHISTQTDASNYCTTKIWQSMAASKDGVKRGEGRYMWIDLNADTPTYGPNTKGTGSILPNTLPQRRGLGTSSSTNDFLYNIATFIHHTTRQLISPPISHSSRYDWAELEIRLIMVHDHKVGMLEQSENFDWESIKQQLFKIKRLPHQSITFSKAEISLLENVYAAQAKQSSLKVLHSGTKGTQQYLDSKELHFWLSQHNLAFVPELDDRNNREIIPVFLFDISFKDLLLLDRVHQAVSFNDMVIAIQTQSKRITDFKCDNILTKDATDATRPVLAALLETVWGIAPTHISLSKNSDTPDLNYIWSMGFDPFSVFSIHKEISFSQADSATRNQIYFQIIDSLKILQTIYNHIDEDETWEEFSKSNPGIQSIFELRKSIHEILYEVGQHLSNHQEIEAYDKVNSLQSLTSSLTETIHSNHNLKHSYLDCRQPTLVYSELVSIIVTFVLILVLTQKLLKSKFSF